MNFVPLDFRNWKSQSLGRVTNYVSTRDKGYWRCQPLGYNEDVLCSYRSGTNQNENKKREDYKID